MAGKRLSPNTKKNTPARKATKKKYDSQPAQKARNRARKRARYKLEKAGVVKKGDGKDVHHKDNNPLNNKRSNLKVTSPSRNRSVPKGKTGRRRRVAK